MAKTCESELREYLLRHGAMAMGPDVESTCAWALEAIEERDKRIENLLFTCKWAYGMDHDKPYPVEVLSKLHDVIQAERNHRHRI